MGGRACTLLGYRTCPWWQRCNLHGAAAKPACTWWQRCNLHALRPNLHGAAAATQLSPSPCAAAGHRHGHHRGGAARQAARREGGPPAGQEQQQAGEPPLGSAPCISPHHAAAAVPPHAAPPRRRLECALPTWHPRPQKARKRKSLEKALAVASRTETKVTKSSQRQEGKKGLKKLWQNEGKEPK